MSDERDPGREQQWHEPPADQIQPEAAGARPPAGEWQWAERQHMRGDPARPASASTRARLAMGLLGAAAVFGILEALLGVGGAWRAPESGDSATVLTAFVFLGAVLRLSAGVAFLMWLHRAYLTLPTLGAQELRFSPGTAVRSFFVPFLHLIRPYQAVTEVWAASDPDAPASDAAARARARVAPLLEWWWGLWMVCSALGFLCYAPFVLSGPRIPVRFFAFVAEVPGFRDLLSESLSVVTTVSGLAYLAAAVLAVLLVQDIDWRQRTKAARLRQ